LKAAGIYFLYVSSSESIV